MSIKLMNLVFQANLAKSLPAKSSSTSKYVLLALANRANDEGSKCYPSIERLAHELEMSTRSVLRALSTLEEGKLIARTQHKNATKKRNTYFINVKLLEELSSPFSLDADQDEVNPFAQQNIDDSDVTDCPDDMTNCQNEVTDCPDDMTNCDSKHDGLSLNTLDNSKRKIIYPSTTNTRTPTKQNPTIEQADYSYGEKILGGVDEGFSIFWEAGMRKQTKHKAYELFKSLCQNENLEPVTFAQQLESDIKKRKLYEQKGFDKLSPAKYIEDKRWLDELIDDRNTSKGTGYVHDLSDMNYNLDDSNELPDWMRD